MTARDVDRARIEVLGQVAVVRDRLDRLEEELVGQPVGAGTNEEIVNAIGNLSFQVGMLMGVVSDYREVAGKKED